MSGEQELLIESCEFWFVWTKTGRLPRYVHWTQQGAENEADRLAREHPTKKFIVLRAYRKVQTITVGPIQDYIDAARALAVDTPPVAES